MMAPQKMNLKNIMVVFGTRPEAIKMAPLVHALKALPDEFLVQVCVSGQHRQMLDQVLDVFDITPDIDLNIMRPDQDISDTTSSVLLGLRSIFVQRKPDIVLVHGDTTTSMAAAISAYYAGIGVGHVEAGLRTGNIYSPFPEEINRQIISRIAKWHFAPTAESRLNLLAENIDEKNIIVTGNTVIDALYLALENINSSDNKKNKIESYFKNLIPFNIQEKPFAVVTSHRRENFGNGILEITLAILSLARSFPQFHWVFPVHLNPNIRQVVNKVLSNVCNVHLVDPMGYDQFIYLLQYCSFILTDSGGLQEEGPSLGKPVLVMRSETERPEAVRAGTVRLVGANTNNIVQGVTELLVNSTIYDTMSKAHNPYGDGFACLKIINALRGVQ